MVERLVYTERVGGSNPSPPIFHLRFSIGERDAETLAIPFAEFVSVLQLEENPADALSYYDNISVTAAWQ